MLHALRHMKDSVTVYKSNTVAAKASDKQTYIVQNTCCIEGNKICKHGCTALNLTNTPSGSWQGIQHFCKYAAIQAVWHMCIQIQWRPVRRTRVHASMPAAPPAARRRKTASWDVVALGKRCCHCFVNCSYAQKLTAE